VLKKQDHAASSPLIRPTFPFFRGCRTGEMHLALPLNAIKRSIGGGRLWTMPNAGSLGCGLQ